MGGMKLSVSLPDKDVAFIDRQVTENGERSRSAVIRKALRRLRSEELKRQYAQLWAEWDDEDDVWDVTVGDGIEDESDVAWCHRLGRSRPSARIRGSQAPPGRSRQ